MQVSPECIVCLFQLALRAARTATDDETLQQRVLTRLASEIAELPAGTLSPQVGRRVQRIVREVTGVADPYQAARRSSNQLALSYYPQLERRVAEARDPLLEAIRLAVAGNVIDLAVGAGFDLQRSIRESLDGEFAIFEYQPFLDALAGARRLLYVGDNAGEIVFDRLLVEQLTGRGIEVTFAVRGGPAINDAVREDANQAGLSGRVELIDTGTDLPTVMLSESSAGFRQRYDAADLVISKGQGNFEGLCEQPGPILFLLRAKCAPVARRLGVDRGALVLHFRQEGSGAVRG